MAEEKTYTPKQLLESLRLTRRLLAKQEESRKTLLQLEKVLWHKLPDKYKFGLRPPE